METKTWIGMQVKRSGLGWMRKNDAHEFGTTLTRLDYSSSTHDNSAA